MCSTSLISTINYYRLFLYNHFLSFFNAYTFSICNIADGIFHSVEVVPTQLSFHVVRIINSVEPFCISFFFCIKFINNARTSVWLPITKFAAFYK